MNQARLSLPVNTLYNALHFFINYFTFVKLMELISFAYLKASYEQARGFYMNFRDRLPKFAILRLLILFLYEAAQNQP
ncbi:hypothetical protein GNF10_34780 [Nostoc sp. UCD121]|uniref:hypothetical protein n=1 Tax=unclassified Nostoc TaxID=2593658 RepID=UPI0016280B50|nr:MULTISPECIES: hypothetical protein [unclassified Nostoc]MBC1220987.1 hypothetical protein [Nostoc sp. UCD120]MBC1280959.1 hypothetical protein [Nostoc sp. UCD121]MBC1299377.1 hypothetical protein [Nostoc sp. UCD122]